MDGHGVMRINMGLETTKTEKIKHNMVWINHNRGTAKEYAEKYCPFGKLMDEINSKLDCGLITQDQIEDFYNPETDTVMKIEAREGSVNFSIVYAKNGDRTVESYPLHYEYDPKKYYDILRYLFNTFQKKLDIAKV